MTDIPIVMGPEGRVNRTPADLRADLVGRVAAEVPGYTADLPAALIEDIASTDVAALVITDQALTDLINSMTPYGANETILRAQAAVAGVEPQAVSNTSVFIVFSGTPGFVIAKGFTVSDGTHQYIVQDGGIIATGGASDPLYCLATVAGSWSVPANSVTTLVTLPPSSVTLSCNNPTAGTPSGGEETVGAYRAHVIDAFSRSAAQGMPTFLRTQLGNVAGVQLRLISIQQGVGGWKILVGGGDPYQVAYAIYDALFDIAILQGSATTVRNITVAINDFPNSYQIIYVNPPVQNVGIALTWNTNDTSYVSDSAVEAAAKPALAAYINGIYAGEPINVFQLESVFKAALTNIVPPEFITRMVFVVSIDGTPTPPVSGTGIINGDPEGYFLTNTTAISVTRG